MKLIFVAIICFGICLSAETDSNGKSIALNDSEFEELLLKVIEMEAKSGDHENWSSKLYFGLSMALNVIVLTTIWLLLKKQMAISSQFNELKEENRQQKYYLEELELRISCQRDELNTKDRTTDPNQQNIIDSITYESLFNEQRNRLENMEIITNSQTALIDEQRKELDTFKNKINDSISSVIKQLKDENKQQNSSLKAYLEAIVKSELDTFKGQTIPLIDGQRKELNVLNKKFVPEQPKLIDSLRADINHLKSNPVPIGFIYVQLSGQSEPNTLWPNTEWENISDKYSGLFFRAEGRQSEPFGQIQLQQTKSLSVYSESSEGLEYKFKEWEQISDTESTYVVSGRLVDGNRYGLKFKFNSEEVRPRNQAIRIWFRIK